MGRRPFCAPSGLAPSQGVLVCLLALTTSGCAQPTSAPPPSVRAKAPDAGFLNQWRPGQNASALAKTWYFTTQGSYLLDFDVFMSIARPSDNALFSSRDNLESYGFLYPDNYDELGIHQGEPSNSLALPIGVVKDTRGDGHTPLAKHAAALTKDYVGLTCAACHTGDVKYHGERFLIHAGQSNLDYERFMSELSAAVSKAMQDPKGSGYL